MKFNFTTRRVEEHEIKTLKQRLLLVRLHSNKNDEGCLGFTSGARFCLENRKTMTLDDFKRHLEEARKICTVMDEYESSYIYALEENIRELEGVN